MPRNHDMRNLARTHPKTALSVGVAVLLSAWIASEGLGPTSTTSEGEVVTHPYIPTDGDVPTIGHGTTYYKDGSKVTMADPPITLRTAKELAAWHLSDVYSKCVVTSLGDTPISAKELNLAIDFAGQYGCGAWQGSSVLKAYLSGDYAQACKGYTRYRYMTSTTAKKAPWEPYRYVNGKPTRWKYDCSVAGNKVCYGVWKRSKGRETECLNVVAKH